MRGDHTRRRENASTVKVLGLISTGHFCSHFYYLVLPPLFPLLRDAYGVGFTELGLAITVSSLSNTLTAAPVGMLVDRYGARAILIGGLALEGLAFALIALFPSYAALLALMAVIGIANSVFHPADYAMLDAVIGDARMGRAFSIHTFGGYLGTAIAPITVIYVTEISDWQTAVLLSGVAGLVVAGLLALNYSVLPDTRRADAPGDRGKTRRRDGAVQVLFATPIVLGLVFFAMLGIAEYGISDFGISTLHLIHGVPLSSATLALSAYLLAAPVGVLLGGWLADNSHRHDVVAAACMLTFAICVTLSAALEPAWEVLILLFAVAGLAVGLVAPSRDLMIRGVTPPGDMGKVFGFVSMGFNIAGIIAPPMFGLALDHTDPRLLFFLAAIFGVISAAVALATGRAGSRRRDTVSALR